MGAAAFARNRSLRPHPARETDELFADRQAGEPRSSGYTLNLSRWPEQNIDLTVQYTGYLRFNGGQTYYDGAGRNAGGITPSSYSGDLSSDGDPSAAALELLVLGKIAGEKAC